MKLTTLPQRSDLILAGALAVVGVIGTAGTDDMTGVDRHVGALAFALVLANAVTVAFRRRLPLVTLAVTALLTSAYLVIGYPYGPIFFPFFVAVYTAAAHRPPAAAARVALGALGVLLVHLFTNEAALAGFAGVVPASAWVVVPFAIGVTVRLTREAHEREQAEAVRRRVYDERLRIAQEVHDVVGHGLAAIKMQADVALHVLAKKPEQAERALTAISRTSTEALEEVRATLGVVRQIDDSDRLPPPGLDRLDELRQRMTEAGVQVDIDTTGIPRELPAAVDLAGYRVVQESLTNVLRHGERKIASVRVAYAPDALVIAISNPASDASAARTGFGINGMAERVTALGGEFSAGPTGGGRFEVRASIPTGGTQ
ncbi:MAG: sensor histidine kinase [Actinomadura sp.]